ncbi:MAG TPA: class I SAM-dependent methyltransferase, partial [Vicinamibacteria bacterium]|nr:class I SAM-dependent methyltransferase [Vicinamibacteria bacterium]
AAGVAVLLAEPVLVPRGEARCTLVPVRCAACGAAESEPVTRGQDYEYQTTGDVFTVTRCRACGFHFLNPRPEVGDLDLIYPRDYYSYDYEGTCHPAARWGRLQLDRRKARQWLAAAPTPRPRFLDIGCGDGRYLRLFRAWGVPPDQLWGTELDASAVRRLQEEGFQVRQGMVESTADLPAGYFQLVVLIQLIEHVADPFALLRRIEALLAPGGIVVVETPDIHGLDARLFRDRFWGGYHFPRHWHFFDEAALREMATRAGLEVVALRHLPSPVFWVYSLHHVARWKWGRPRLAALLNPFRNVPLVAAATALDMLRAALGGRTSNMQLVARKPG